MGREKPQAEKAKRYKLWYRQPAECWTKALPIGSGRLGGMVFGGTVCERIALNESTLWSGYPKDTNVPHASEYLAKARALARHKQYTEAQQLIEDTMLGPYTQAYMPLGDLRLNFDLPGDVTEYIRSLSLNDAVCRCSFTADGVRYEREVFATCPDQAIVLRLTASKPGRISFKLSAESQLLSHTEAEGDTLTLAGRAPSEALPSYLHDPNPIRYEDAPEKRGMRFQAVFRVLANGGVTISENDTLRVRDADDVTILVCARTSFNGFDKQPYTNGVDERALCRRDCSSAAALTYSVLLNRHIHDFSSLYERVTFTLMQSDVRESLPTDERLRAFADQPDDSGLTELLFHYGRYLLISCSRPGGEPANLQGLWNAQLCAPWSSNYTTNINVEMNYWPAEIVGLSETHQPLLRAVGELAINGKLTAEIHYGARGAVVHHNTDLWRLSSPVGDCTHGTAGYAFWPMGLGWLCEHLFEHYLYTCDKKYLRTEALPPMREAVRFFLDMLTPDDEGWLCMSPMTSPENAFLYRGGRCCVSASAAMSEAIVREALENYLSALAELETDEEMSREVREALTRLRPFRIGSRGQLLEWNEEFEECEPHHRHLSHLYGLYPSRRITPESKLYEACRRSLEERGDDGTGWSLGWKISLWARLRDGSRALALLKRQLRCVRESDITNYTDGGGTYENLFDAHPPFQIDGNFGACAGIAEMLLQTSEDDLLLLPALPAEWPSGRVSGLRAHGGLEVDIEFSEGAVTRAVVRRIARCDKPIRVCWSGKSRVICPALGEAAEIV